MDVGLNKEYLPEDMLPNLIEENDWKVTQLPLKGVVKEASTSRRTQNLRSRSKSPNIRIHGQVGRKASATPSVSTQRKGGAGIRFLKNQRSEAILKNGGNKRTTKKQNIFERSSKIKRKVIFT